MKPILFESTAQTFNTNGIGILNDAAECKVREQRNGEYELTMQYPIDGLHYKEIINRRLIYAQVTPYGGQEPFRIYNISRPLSGLIEVQARHISYDQSGIPVAPFTAVTAADALKQLKSHAVVSNPFVFSTDKVTTANMTVTAPTSMRALLGGTEGSILDTYRGEFFFTHFLTQLLTSRGQNRGVVIRYGKNLIDLRQEENIAKMYTGVYPYYVDSETGEITQLPGKIVAVPGTFDFTNILMLDVSGDFDSPPTAQQLTLRAQSYINDNDLGTPTVSISLSYQDIAQTLETSAPTEMIKLCDTVTVIYEKLGIETTAKVTETEYDVLRDRYTAINIGDIRANIADTIYSNAQAVEQTAIDLRTETGKAIANATQLITGTKGGNFVFQFNSDGKPMGFSIMDTDDVLTATNVWRFNLGGLGYSSKGYNGPFGTAITQDGKIVADFIQAGALSSDNVTVGGFTLSASSLRNGMTSFDDTTHDGVYVGIDGIALGKGAFKVDKYGNLTATSGKFTGGVYAASILTEADETGAGYIEGDQVDDYTLSGGDGGNLEYDTVAPGNTDSTLSGYVSRGTTAYGQCNGGNISSNYISVNSLATGVLGVDGHDCYLGTLSINGISHNVVMWG
jgi:phage minor structural protein